MRTEPSVLRILKVASASQGYFCSTISSMTSTARALEIKGMRQLASAISLNARLKALFIPQRHHRIDLHCAACGNVTGERRGHDEQADDGTIGDNVCSADSVEHRTEQTRETERSRNPQSDTR